MTKITDYIFLFESMFGTKRQFNRFADIKYIVGRVYYVSYKYANAVRFSICEK